MTVSAIANRRTSLIRSSAHGALWALMQNVNVRAVNFLSQIILARILVPEDFGLIGLTYTVTNVMGTLTGFGLDDVLMARPKALHLWSAPAFGISLTLSLVGASCMIALAPAAALIYRAHELNGLISILAVAMVIGTAAMVPEMNLRREMRFGFLAGYGLVSTVGAQTLTIFLAWKGFGPYAFVIPGPIFGLVKLLVFYRSSRLKMNGCFKVRRWKSLLQRGSLLFGQRFINTIRDQGDYFILGITTSPAVVGTYMLAFRLAAQPVYALASSLNVVLLPVLGSLSYDRERQTEAALRAIRIMAFTVIPFCFLQASIAGPVIKALFGPQWLGAIPLTQILGSGLAFDIIPCIACSLAIARGRFRFQFLAVASSFPFFVIGIAIGAHSAGALGVAIAVVLYFLVTSLGYSYFALAPLRQPLSVMVNIWVAPALLSSAAACVSVMIGKARLFDAQPLVGAGVSFIAGLVVFVTLLRITLPQTALSFLQELQNYRRSKLS